MRNVPLRRLSAGNTGGGRRRTARELLAAAALALTALALPAAAAPAAEGAHFVTLPAQRRVPSVPRTARALGRLEAGAQVPLSISLPLRDEAGLQDLLKRLYDPADPLFHQFVSQPEFARRFGPTQADYDAVAAFAQTHGLSVTYRSPTRSVLNVVGTRAAVETAFGTQLTKYQMAGGRIAYSNTVPPRIPAALSYKIAAIVGLSTVNLEYRSHLRRFSSDRTSPFTTSPLIQTLQSHAQLGSGPMGGLAPADIKTAYSLAAVAPTDLSGLTGQGQTLGLYELDGYLPADIAGYTTQFGLPTANLTNVLYNSFAGTVGADSSEVTLDIEMMVALAPKAHIIVYETQNITPQASALYQKIADDNLAKSVSSSFGLPEASANDGSTIATESHAFQQMQAQGQSFFAAAGDNGAYDDGTTLSVDDPAANPAVTGVGGTSLTIKADSKNYVSETTWNNGSATAGAGGGGVSTIFPLPAYQVGITTAASQAHRNVPDVSLNADPNTGYVIYVNGGFQIVGGTSAAAPLWAAFTGLVNEQRADFGQNTTVGFINPALYALALTSQYSATFHDINDGSTNLQYVAAAGYDNATGLGTFVGDQLLAALAPSTSTPVTLTGTVLDSSGKPVSGSTVTITTLQIANFARTPAISASGAFTQTLDSQAIVDTATGTTKPITYTVSADAAGYAGQTLSVTPATTPQVALTLSTPQFTFVSNTLQMVSAPYEYAGAGDFATLFGLTPPLSGTGHNLVVWSPLQSVYVYYPSAPADTFHLGQGYWTALPTNAYIRRIGAPAPPGPFHISLQQGWNQIGDPFGYNVTLSNIQVSVPATGAVPNPSSSPIGQSTLVAVPLYAYPPGASAYTTLGASSQIQPWLGYWIYANQPAVLTIPNS